MLDDIHALMRTRDRHSPRHRAGHGRGCNASTSTPTTAIPCSVGTSRVRRVSTTNRTSGRGSSNPVHHPHAHRLLRWRFGGGSVRGFPASHAQDGDGRGRGEVGPRLGDSISPTTTRTAGGSARRWTWPRSSRLHDPADSPILDDRHRRDVHRARSQHHQQLRPWLDDRIESEVPQREHRRDPRRGAA